MRVLELLYALVWHPGNKAGPALKAHTWKLCFLARWISVITWKKDKFENQSVIFCFSDSKLNKNFHEKLYSRTSPKHKECRYCTRGIAKYANTFWHFVSGNCLLYPRQNTECWWLSELTLAFLAECLFNTLLLLLVLTGVSEKLWLTSLCSRYGWW